MLLVVDFLAVEWSVVEQDLDAISASFLQTADRPVVEQIRQASRAGLVIAGFLVGEQQASILGAPLGGGQAPFGVEQDGAGMGREDFGD